MFHQASNAITGILGEAAQIDFPLPAFQVRKWLVEPGHKIDAYPVGPPNSARHRDISLQFGITDSLDMGVLHGGLSQVTAEIKQHCGCTRIFMGEPVEPHPVRGSQLNPNGVLVQTHPVVAR